MTIAGPIELNLHNEPLPLSAPFRIAGHVFEAMPATVVTLRDGMHVGRGEAAGVYYTNDHPEGMIATLEALRSRIEAGMDRQTLRTLLPAGGARNALDCALWELESQRSGIPVWKLAGLQAVRPLLTTFTVGADDPAVMADRAAAYAQARALKLKLTGDPDLDGARVRAVRARCPEAWIGVDANQGYNAATLPLLLPALLEARVSLFEQPCVRGREGDLDGIERALPFAADESILDLAELEARHHRFDVINIKLDKCGGLTEGLLMARRARELGKQGDGRKHVRHQPRCGTGVRIGAALRCRRFGWGPSSWPRIAHRRCATRTAASSAATKSGAPRPSREQGGGQDLVRQAARADHLVPDQHVGVVLLLRHAHAAGLLHDP